MVLSKEDYMMLYVLLRGNACCFKIEANFLRKNFKVPDFILFKEKIKQLSSIWMNLLRTMLCLGDGLQRMSLIFI